MKPANAISVIALTLLAAGCGPCESAEYEDSLDSAAGPEFRGQEQGAEAAEVCRGTPEEYGTAVRRYAGREGMTRAWIEFMERPEERAHYCLGLEQSRQYRGRPIRFSVSYYPGREDPRWARNEELHLTLMEEILELTYPGYEFELEFGLDPERADGRIQLRRPDNPFRHGTFIGLGDSDAIVPHEVGHFLGLYHHYSSNATVGDHEHTPPPGDQKCLMDRTQSELDSACRFALDIPVRETHSKAIADLVTLFNREDPE